MPTVNYNLKNASMETIEAASAEYLRGWHDPMKKYGFRAKGLNAERVRRGLEPLTKEMSDKFRIDYVVSNYDLDTIKVEIEEFMLTHRLSNARYGAGIELFDCRFGSDYARLFKVLIGSHEYRRIAEKCRVDKLTETQKSLYGGVGLAGCSAKEKAYITSAKTKKEFLLRAGDHLRLHGCILENLRNSSIFEVFAYVALVDKFGKDDVLVDYGVHPYDARYPYPCDFYIKSRDLFIELNMHFTHGGHWFDDSNGSDVLRKTHLEQTDRARNRKFLSTWCDHDVRKRKAAKLAGLSYLAFWDGKTHRKGTTIVPNMSDFHMWLVDYDCDTKRFIMGHPENTY